MNFLIYFVIEADELVSFPQSIMDKTVIDQTNRAVQIFHRPRYHILTYFLVRFHSHKEVVPQLCLTPIQVSVNSRKWMAPCPYIHFAPFQNSTSMLEQLCSFPNSPNHWEIGVQFFSNFSFLREDQTLIFGQVTLNILLTFFKTLFLQESQIRVLFLKLIRPFVILAAKRQKTGVVRMRVCR